ncbi:MAG: MobA/MobL family protein [Nitrososphaerota archaeon]|jgi:hypothetical protein|nr:MobA/MobL family protein [Nitrososphaerota archaeon]
MAIFYMDANIIGRSSGRSAVGASAYRRSEKMHSIAHAAYQRGEKIIAEGEYVVHDYSRKGGVVHSEILLPEGAPPEFMDAQALWNAVENKETYKNARLAREIVVALPIELSLQEQIEVLREYLMENFVSKGVGVDFSIHNNGDGNPHSHIMITTRFITSEGLGKKNRDLDRKSELLVWRKSWADVNNRMFERKGLEERIDHRSYKERGIDREPQVHMGHKATALERKGIKTEKGDHNRAVQKRNNEREKREKAEKESVTADGASNGVDETKRQLQSAKSVLIEEDLRLKRAEKTEKLSATPTPENDDESNAPKERLEVSKKLQTTRDNEKPLKDELIRTELWKLIEDQRIVRYKENLQKQEENRIARKNLKELERYFISEKASQHAEKLQATHAMRKEIKKTTQYLNDILESYSELDNDKTALSQELKALKREPSLDMRTKELDITLKTLEITATTKTMRLIELEYKKEKLLAQTRFNKQQLDKLLTTTRKPPINPHEKQRYEQNYRQLNTITEDNFQKILEILPQKEAQAIQYAKKMQEQQQINQILNALRERHVSADRELYARKREYFKSEEEIPRLSFRIERIEEQAESYEKLQRNAEQLQAKRRKTSLWAVKKKKELALKIEEALRNLRVAQHRFKIEYDVEPSESQAEIKRIHEEINAKKRNIELNTTKISKLSKIMDNTETEYQKHLLLIELRPDKAEIHKLIKSSKPPPKGIREKIFYDKAESRLNTITNETLPKILEKLTPEQAKRITEKREQAQTKEMEKIAKERVQNRTIERSR